MAAEVGLVLELLDVGAVGAGEDTPVDVAGVVAVGMGSNLITRSLLADGDYAAIAEGVRRTLEIIARQREKKV